MPSFFTQHQATAQCSSDVESNLESRTSGSPCETTREYRRKSSSRVPLYSLAR